jgi:hypothetical protein
LGQLKKRFEVETVIEKGLLDHAGTEYKEYSFLEFRAGAVLTAPRLDVTSGEQFETLMKRDPLSIKSARTLLSFSDNRYHKTINSLNRAHALLISCNKADGKTKPIHYEYARNEFLHKVAKCPVIDGQGVEHSDVFKLPKPILDFCVREFRFPYKESKRTADSLESAAETGAPSKKVALEKTVKSPGDLGDSMDVDFPAVGQPIAGPSRPREPSLTRSNALKKKEKELAPVKGKSPAASKPGLGRGLGSKK